MKTLENLYNEIIGSDELKKAFAAAVREGKLEDFLKAHDCEATEEEAETFLKERQEEKGEILDSELESVVGGMSLDEAYSCAFISGQCGVDWPVSPPPSRPK